MRKLSTALMGLLVGSGLMAAAAPHAYADTISFTLQSPLQYALPGSTTSFIATVSAPITNTTVEDLNGDSFLVGLPATLDDTGYNGFPLSLNPGDSFTGLLFTVTLPNISGLGIVNGEFTILGGAGASLDPLGSVNFTVEPTPEPASFLLLGTGLAGVLTTVKRRSWGPVVDSTSAK